MAPCSLRRPWKASDCWENRPLYYAREGPESSVISAEIQSACDAIMNEGRRTEIPVLGPEAGS